MKIIPLTQGKVAWVDDLDYPTVSMLTWCAHKKGRVYYTAHAIKNPDGTAGTIGIHGFLFPAAEEVHHRDGDGLNNQRSNLRVVTHKQNLQGFRRKAVGKSSVFRGVSWSTNRRKWEAKINSNGKTLHLGRFLTEVEAARAYDRAAVRIFQENAATNFSQTTG